MKMSSCAFTLGCPTYSASRRGRMALSTASSSRVASAPIVLSACKMGLLRRRALQGAADQLFGGMCTRTHRLQQACRFCGLVAEGHQRTEGLGLGTRSHGHCARSRRAACLHAVAHLDDQALGGLAADARHLDERRHIVALHAPRKRLDTDAREQRQGDLRADTGDFDQTAKETPLVLRAEGIEHVRVLTDHEVREEAHFLSDRRQMKEGRHRHLELVAEATGLHEELRWDLRDDAPPYRSDHRDGGCMTSDDSVCPRDGAAACSASSWRRREWA